MAGYLGGRSASVKRTQQRLLNAGLCIRCGKRQPRNDSKCCETCLSRGNRYIRDRHARLIALGLCRCGKDKIAPGRLTCESCLLRMRSRRPMLLSKGLCTQCGKEKTNKATSTCRSCRMSSLERYRTARIKAIEAVGRSCAVCGESRIGLLDIHHKRKNGSEHRKNKPGLSYWKDIAINPHGLVTLCRECHFNKHEAASDPVDDGSDVREEPRPVETNKTVFDEEKPVGDFQATLFT